jgi:4-hydroxybenzoate polyprenyltransferase
MFAELVKFEHSIFALPFAYIAAIYAAASMDPLVPEASVAPTLPANAWVTVEGWPTISAMVWITVAMVTARAFAFVVNRAVDKEIDARNPRTAGRAVPAGLVKAWELWLFSAITLAIFLVAVWQLHPITRWLWPIVLAAFLVYPYTKRFTWLCHYWLGMCLGLAPVGAWTAITGDPLAPPAYVLGVAVMLWTAGFDIIYATQDIECDRRDGVHSVPADFGVAQGLLFTRLSHIVAVLLLVGFGSMVVAGWPWYVGVAIAAALLVYENAIVSADDLSRVNAAFFTVNGIIAIVVFTGALADRLLG